MSIPMFICKQRSIGWRVVDNNMVIEIFLWISYPRLFRPVCILRLVRALCFGKGEACDLKSVAVCPFLHIQRFDMG